MSIEFVEFNVNVSMILVVVVIVVGLSCFASSSFAATSGILVLDVLLRRNDAGPLWFRLRAGGSNAESSAGVRTLEATVKTDDDDDVDEDVDPKYCRKSVKA